MLDPMNNFHIVNPYDENSNGSNKFTDAYEPILSEHVDAVNDVSKRSKYKLNMKKSTLSHNSGNGLEFRFGADRIERIPLTTQGEIDTNTLSVGPLALDVTARLRDNCVFGNNQGDDLFSEGSNAPNGRDNTEGRDMHDVHIYLPNPEDLNYKVDARRNYWGVSKRRDLYSQLEDEALGFDTKIVAIYSNDLNILPPQAAPAVTSSFIGIQALDKVFDTRNMKRSARGCYMGTYSSNNHYKSFIYR
jgi:hypothetical protein